MACPVSNREFDITIVSIPVPHRSCTLDVRPFKYNRGQNYNQQHSAAPKYNSRKI
jgi:hypothetical protein